MSGVRAARSLQSTPDANVQAMQDVLYDILATGVDAERGDVPIEQVERFLHEHARSPKSAEQFRAFFAQHGLSLRAAASVPPISALPPVPPRAAAAPIRLAVPDAAPPAAATPVLPELESYPVTLDIAPPARRSRVGFTAVVSTAAALLALAGAFYVGARGLTELRTELSRAEAQAAQNRAVIEALRSQTVALESSLAANNQLIERVEQKSDLVLETLEQAREQKPRRR